MKNKLELKKWVSAVVAVALLATIVTVIAPKAYAENEHTKPAALLLSKPEVHIGVDGKVVVRGATVTGINGSSLSAQVAFGSYVSPWTITVSDNTEFVRHYGGNSSLAEIAVGDVVSFSGTLNQGVATPTVAAKVVKDWSIQKKNATFTGSISSINASNATFVLASKERGNLNILTSASTTFMLGNEMSTFGALTVGSRVTTEGVWNTGTSNVQALKVRMIAPTPRVETLEGKIKSIAGTVLPTTLTVTVKGTDYVVNLATGTSVLGKNWNIVSLSSFAVGDDVRFYGAITGTTSNATVIRDLNK